MNYQDAAIRDVIRIGALAVVATVLAVGCAVASPDVRAVLDHIPVSRHGRRNYDTLALALPILAACFWTVSLGILATSPAQHDAWARKMARFDRAPETSRRRPDPLDQDYRTPVWRYWLRRKRA